MTYKRQANQFIDYKLDVWLDSQLKRCNNRDTLAPYWFDPRYYPSYTVSYIEKVIVYASNYIPFCDCGTCFDPVK